MALKVGYFAHSNFSPSETFIYDLVKAFNSDPDIDLTFVTGISKATSIDFKMTCIATTYSEHKKNWESFLYKAGQIAGGGRGYKYKMWFQQQMALKTVIKSNLVHFDVAFVEYATSGVLLMKYFRIKKIPFVVHVHGYDITSSLSDPAYKLQLTSLFDSAAYFIAASNYMKRRLILLGCNENKIHVIRLGVNSEGIVPLSWAQRKSTNPSIIFLGRLTEKKHPLALLYAFKIVKEKISNATLSIIGEGVLKKEIEQVIIKLGLSSSVKMYGVLNRKESFPVLNKHWIYAQHSVTSINGDTEGFAISLAEAALHQLPVVSTIHNGITENVVDGETGFLVPEYDYEAMAEKIIFLIQHPEIAEEMGRSGRKHILNLCEPITRVKKIKDILMNVSNRKV